METFSSFSHQYMGVTHACRRTGGMFCAGPGAGGEGGSWPRCLLYRAAHTQRRIYHGVIIGENFTFRLPGGGQGSFSAPMFPPARRLCFHAPGEIQCIQVAREQQAASSPKSVSGASKMSFSKNKVSGLARSTGACFVVNAIDMCSKLCV